MLALTAGAANADTVFNVSGSFGGYPPFCNPQCTNNETPPLDLASFSGTITINTVTGAVDAAAVMVAPNPSNPSTGLVDFSSLVFTTGSTLVPSATLSASQILFDQEYSSVESGPQSSGVADFYNVFLLTSNAQYILELTLETAAPETEPPTTLVGYTGGYISELIFQQQDGEGDFIAQLGVCGGDLGVAGELSGCGSASEVTPTTPLPAALPLFAGGLGVMGLLGWRRKRKATVAAA